MNNIVVAGPIPTRMGEPAKCGLGAAKEKFNLKDNDSPIALIRRFDLPSLTHIPYISA